MIPKRTFRLRERAAADDDVRWRIVEAATRLYEQEGPPGATIGAIADAAGVRPVTVFRHFPGETALVQACASHWLGLNPPPDPEDWTAERNARRRVSAALRVFFAYYAASSLMLAAAFRHRADTPGLQGPMDALTAFTATVAADLASAFPAVLSERIADRLEHVLAFPGWHDLQARGLDDPGKIALVETAIDEILFGRDG